EPELIEGRTVRRIRAGRREGRAQPGRVDRLAVGAVRTAARHLARRRIRRVRASPRGNAVRCERASLWRGRWHDVIVEAAVLVIREEQDRVVPVWAAPARAHDLRLVVLAGSEFARRLAAGVLVGCGDGLIG